MLSKDIWNEYKKIGIVDSGVFGFIYKAKNKIKGDYVLIEEINKDIYKKFTTLDLTKEEIQYKLSLDNNIKEIKETNKYCYIIKDLFLCNMKEYLNMRKDDLSIEEIKEILIQLNKSIKMMNEKNIIYKDIKPENVLIYLKNINKYSFTLSNNILF